MSIDSFGTRPPWIQALIHEAEEIRNYNVNSENVSRNSWRFRIKAANSFVVGKTHNHKQKDKFELDFPEELGWIDETTDLPYGLEHSDVEEIFSVVIVHKSEGKYESEEDDFMVLTECILEEKRSQGVRLSFDIDGKGGETPEEKYKNCWQRIFKHLE